MPHKFEKRYKIPQKIKHAAPEYYKMINRGYIYTGQESFQEKLADLGWKHIGSGVFSSVFSNPRKPYIIKVNDGVDKAFAIFAKFAKKFPNIHFPMIGEMKQFKYKNKIYYIYLIEKLYPIGNKAYDYAPDINDLTSAFILNLRSKKPKSDEEVYKDFVLDDNSLSNIFKKQPTLIRACKSLANCYKASSIRLVIDIHEGNIMKRKDGTIVVIDPFS